MALDTGYGAPGQPSSALAAAAAAQQAIWGASTNQNNRGATAIPATTGQDDRGAPVIMSSTPSQQVTQQGLTFPTLNFGAAPQTPNFGTAPTGQRTNPIDLSGLSQSLAAIAQQQAAQFSGIRPPNLQTPNVTVPTYNVPRPEYVAPPQNKSYLDFLRANGFDPNSLLGNNQNTSPVGNSSSGASGYSGGGGSGGVAISAPSVAWSAPAYTPSVSIADRVKAMLQAEFGGQETQLQANQKELGIIFDAAQKAQEEYARTGDERLKAVYDELHGILSQQNTDILSGYDTGYNKVNSLWDRTQNRVAQNGQNELSGLAALSQQLGVQAAFPDAGSEIANTNTHYNDMVDFSRASSLENLLAQKSAQEAYGTRMLQSSDQYAADQRSQLQSIVASNLGQIGVERGRELAANMLDQFKVAQQKGAKGVTYQADLEDKDWERNYMQSKDSMQFSLENAKLGLQAQAMQAEQDRFAQEMGFKNRQALLDALTKGYEYDNQNAMAAYNAQNDYQDRLQTWGNNQFSAGMQGAQLGLDIYGAQNNVAQQNFGNQMSMAQAMSGILGGQRDDLGMILGAQNSNNQLIMDQNNQEFNQWKANQDLLQSNFNNQMSIWGQNNQNSVAQNSANMGMLDRIFNRQDAATQASQFNADYNLRVSQYMQDISNGNRKYQYDVWRANQADKNDTFANQMAFAQFMASEDQRNFANRNTSILTNASVGNTNANTTATIAGIGQQQQQIAQAQTRLQQSQAELDQRRREYEAAQQQNATANELAQKKYAFDVANSGYQSALATYGAIVQSVNTTGQAAQVPSWITSTLGAGAPGTSASGSGSSPIPSTVTPAPSDPSKLRGAFGAQTFISSSTNPVTGTSMAPFTYGLQKAQSLWDAYAFLDKDQRASKVLSEFSKDPSLFSTSSLPTPQANSQFNAGMEATLRAFLQILGG